MIFRTGHPSMWRFLPVRTSLPAGFHVLGAHVPAQFSCGGCQGRSRGCKVHHLATGGSRRVTPCCTGSMTSRRRNWHSDGPGLLLRCTGSAVSRSGRSSVCLSDHPRGDANDVVGYVLSCYCVFYGLLLGLIAVAVYQNFVSVEEIVQRESSALAGLYDDFESYPEPFGKNLRGWSGYRRYVIKYAWPLQHKGVIPEEGEIRIQGLRSAGVVQPPKPPRAAPPRRSAEAIQRVPRFRRHRLFSVMTGFLLVMWYVVIVGTPINLAMAPAFELGSSLISSWGACLPSMSARSFSLSPPWITTTEAR